ncbi:MAG: hypothetical protein HQ464_04840 [Planctomycetes bacterium]|nr:hypothetical protein [Planctomycetota bacterium]
MPSIVFVARPLPSDIGPGGKHRTYQIEHDLKAGFGADRMHTLSLMEWRARHAGGQAASTSSPQLTRRIVRRIADCLDNPLGILHGTGYGSRTFAPRGFVREYRALLERLPRPIVTVIDDARFTGIVAVAREFNVPVVAITHNLESLDLAAADAHGSWGMRTHLIDFANELGLLQRFAGRMFISKVETGLVGGLGLEAEHYPYLPVGAIHERLEAIRHERLRAEQEPGLFLLLGSAMHGTTRRAFEWFLAQARQHGLPPGVRLVLAGMDTDTLDLRGTSGIEALGWVSQPDLDRLLVTARAVVVPQFSGFGSVTRLVELSCAGVPAITSSHPTRAIDLPPGVHVLGDSWPEWHDLLHALADTPEQTAWDYAAWEAIQPQTLHRSLSRWIREE